MALRNACAIISCPTRSPNDCGRKRRASTVYSIGKSQSQMMNVEGEFKTKTRAKVPVDRGRPLDTAQISSPSFVRRHSSRLMFDFPYWCVGVRILPRSEKTKTRILERIRASWGCGGHERLSPHAHGRRLLKAASVKT